MPYFQTHPHDGQSTSSRPGIPGIDSLPLFVCLFCFVLFVCLFVCENAPAVSLSPKELVVIPLADPESLQSEWATIWWNS
jgi:hypothetical protein